MTTNIYILITTLLLFGNFAYGQFSSKKFTVNEGLSINEVTDLYIDQKMHYLWICTNNGLNRFDGHRFETKYIERKEGKVSHFINALVEDASHQFWIATNRGLACYDYQKDQWIDVNKELQVGIYTKLAQLNDSLLYAVRDNDQLIEINTKNQQFKVIEKTLIESIFQLESINNQLLLGGWKGLYTYSPSTQKISQIEQGKITNATLVKYLEDETLWVRDNNNIWFIPAKNGIPQYSNAIDLTPFLVTENDSKIHVSDIVTYQGDYLICMNSKLYKINKTDIGKKSLKAICISSHETVKVAVDQYHNIWGTTWKEGFYQLENSDKPFKSVTYQTKGDQSLSLVRGFAALNASELLIQTDNRSYFIFDQNTGILTPHRTLKEATTKDKKALTIVADWRGRIWTGHLQTGVKVLSGPEKEAINKKFSQQTKRRHYMAVNDFLVDSVEQKVYMVGASHIYQFSEEKQEFKIDRVDGRQLYCIEKDRATGYFWLGSGQGLQVFDASFKDKVQAYQDGIKNAGLEDARINCLYQDHQGVIWIGTYGDGLFYYQKGNEQIIEVELPEYLDVKVVYSMMDDQTQTTLWFSTNSGLIAYHKPSKTFKKYSTEDGILGNQFCYRSSFRAKDGTLFFGGVKGFTYFHPDNLKNKKNTLPAPQFSDFLMGEQKVALFNKIEENEIKIKDHSFEIHFFTPELSNAESYTYAYQLEGFDKGFQYSHLTEPKAIYHHLPSGKYRFKVKVTRPFSDWSEVTYSPWLIVPLPWYKTTTAIIGFTLLFLFLFVLSIWIIKVQLHLKNTAVIARLEQQNTEEISRTKLRFFTDITHEIRTPLTLILGPLNTILENRQFDLPTQKSLRTIQKSAKRLSSLVDELLLFRKAEQNNLHLKLEEVDLYDVVGSTCDWFSYEAETKNISMHLLCSNKDIISVMDREMMEKVLSNLISNALKFTETGGEINVSCDQIDGETMIIIKDNGKGMSEEEVDRVFNRFYASNPSQHAGFGIGLELSQRIVSAHQGEITVDSQLGQGSTFTVKIPKLHPNVEASNTKQSVENNQVNEKENNTLNFPSTVDGKLLIVEDDEEIRNYIADLFKEEFNVVCKKNGQEGLMYAQANTLDLIITDYQMPVMNGVEMCKLLKSDLATSHIPVVLLSAFNEVEDQLRGLEVGADDYIEKPFENKIVYFKIINLLNTRQQLKKSFQKGQPLDLKGLNQQDQRFIKLLNKIILQEIQNEKLAVDFVAEKMKVSRTTLNSKLKSLLNVTPSEYIRKEKLKEAYRLLIEEKYNVTEAAHAVGFSYAYFNTIFKKEFGVSPGKL
ncbi:ATP-binding protein [Flammeovirga sp. SJP92]|uniref:hybrid sensor histidine kinase/response regulator transcription factor n=1 Tax=Flammeovirga sp. SJP92 TaxID=1775430 RepID=UPI0007873476|nr:ATP-binding protein [Flammeovirga sp. SJP92]KXX66510.1 hypothetical protein AVL50_31785 [Flammeovirga sp. SJP92]